MTAFQELPPAAIDALNRLTVKNPSFELLKNFPNLVGLIARIKDVPLSTAKKGELAARFPFHFFLSSLLLYVGLAAVSAANLRPSKKNKVSP